MDADATNYDPEAEKEDNSLCKYDTNPWTEETIEGKTYKKIKGTISSDLTLDSTSNWMISGGVFVGSGTTLTIKEGTTVYAAEDGTVPFLSVSQGGKIMAKGTAKNPIVFTPLTSETPGSWGGIILNGYAPINTGETAEGEGKTGVYGGDQPDDNSGVLKYVRVEYAGKLLTTDNELNGFSFNGVGSETRLEYLQAYKGNDDGFEFFGGTANLSYAVSTGNADDSFDWTHGWSGKGTNWIVEQATDVGDRGIEADNNGDNNSAMPMSKPTVTKVTIKGRGAAAGKGGIKLREGTAGMLSNIVIKGFKDALDIQHATTVSNLLSNPPSLTLDSIKVENSTNNFNISDYGTADSTAAAQKIGAAINTTATGADTGWETGWTKEL